MIFPFVTILFLKYNFNFEIGSVFLMILGTQWYILFNVIAGAMSIPNDLLEAASVFHITGWQKWRYLILPSIFPHLLTGLIISAVPERQYRIRNRSLEKSSSGSQGAGRLRKSGYSRG